MTKYDLPNPWMSIAEVPVSDRGPAVLTHHESPLASLEDVCCESCGIQLPCDERCPHWARVNTEDVPEFLREAAE